MSLQLLYQRYPKIDKIVSLANENREHAPELARICEFVAELAFDLIQYLPAPAAPVAPVAPVFVPPAPAPAPAPAPFSVGTPGFSASWPQPAPPAPAPAPAPGSFGALGWVAPDQAPAPPATPAPPAPAPADDRASLLALIQHQNALLASLAAK